MRAVILAAGRGRRLAPMGWDRPKCLLPVGGESLIRRAMRALDAYGVDRYTVVLGFEADQVLAEIAPFRDRSDVVHNPDFDVTNTVHSLYLARATLHDGFLILNGDVLFDRRIVGLLPSGDRCRLAIEEKPCGEEEVKVVVGPDRRIERIGKTISPDRCMGEFIGVGRFTAAASAALVSALVNINERQSERDLFFEAAVDAILADHVIEAAPIGNLRAVEIDTPEDFAEAQALWDAGRME